MSTKKITYVILTALTLGFISASLSSCRHDDPEVINEEEQKKQEMEEMILSMKAGLDLSELFTGESAVGVWIMSPDSTFLYYHVVGFDESSDGNDWTIDTLYGTWSVFAYKDTPLSGDGIITGYTACFDTDDDSVIPSVDYYIVGEQDGISMSLSQGAIEYFLVNGFDEEDLATRAGKLFGPQTRSIFDVIGNAISSAWDEVVTWVTDRAEDANNWFLNTFNLDRSSYNLDPSESYKLADEAEKKIEEMQGGYGKTNYSKWMGQIYAGKEDKTRICDMNIPGTHDTFTYYISDLKLADETAGRYARTQAKDIRGQWASGVRCFDVRIKSVYTLFLITTYAFERDWLTDDEKNEKVLGTFHGPIFCGRTAEQGLREIVTLLKENPTETALLFMAFEGSSYAADYKMARALMDKFSDYIVLNPTPDMTLKDCAGKMVIFQSWDRQNAYPDYTVGTYYGTGYDTYNNEGFLQFNNLEGHPEARLLAQTRFQASTTDLCTDFWNEKMDLMEQCFSDTNASKGSANCVWALNQASGYVGGQWIHMSYAKNANAMNAWTLGYVYEHKNDKLGIIQMDFAGSTEYHPDGFVTNGGELPKMIVETNRFQ